VAKNEIGEVTPARRWRLSPASCALTHAISVSGIPLTDSTIVRGRFRVQAERALPSKALLRDGLEVAIREFSCGVRLATIAFRIHLEDFV
jgi:hypothetical protein